MKLLDRLTARMAPSRRMTYRRLGRTGLRVSAVGFGTCQLRMVPARQAVATLCAGFERGVNIVHAAPDYEGADDLVAAAIAASGREVFVCSNGYGTIEHFEHLFEATRARFGKKRLELFGIASVEDREILGENVWGAGGMVEFLAAKKRQDRLLSTFCTTHGSPQYIKRLIESGAFDAVMLAYNPLGYHLLSWHVPEPRPAENVAANRELFAVAAAHDVGIMLMEVLGGGLLCDGQAFPRRGAMSTEAPDRPALPSARDVLRHLLRTHPEVGCLIVGTASVEEAEENATAGHAPLDDDPQAEAGIRAAVTHLQATVCSRCGKCEELCSKQLPVSWLFRSGHINDGGAVPFETPMDRQYFDLHAPASQATCATCTDVTCHCPYGIDIPAQLIQVHGLMMTLRARGEVPGPSPAIEAAGPERYSARLLSRSTNGRVATVSVHNNGTHGWHLAPSHPSVSLQVRTGEKADAEVRLRADVPVGERAHFAFEWPETTDPPPGDLWLVFRDTRGATAQEIFLGQLLTSKAGVSRGLSPSGDIHASPGPVDRARYLAHSMPAALARRSRCHAWVQVQNAGTSVWESHPSEGNGVNLVLRFNGDVHTFDLPCAAVAPGETIKVPLQFDVPGSADAHLPLLLDMVRQDVAFFSARGSEPLMLRPSLSDRSPGDVATPRAQEAPRYAVGFLEHHAPDSVVPQSRFGVWVLVQNRGTMTWDPASGSGRHVSVVVTIDGEVAGGAQLAQPVPPLQEAHVHIVALAPPRPGHHRLAVNLVHEGVTFFLAQGVPSLEMALQVRSTPPPLGAGMYELALRSNSCLYQPTGGVSHAADGTGFPLLLRRAKGCHVWDTEGRQYIDYTMGWGCALLGHGHRAIEEAVRQVMGDGPILPMPHTLEMELTAALCNEADIPCAEAVALGKNGSDVCTLAVRLARVATGRKVVLVCGYHGWQDWYAEPLGFAGTGVPDRDPPLVARFVFNSIESLHAAIATHRRDLAAVMLEPSGPSGGIQGPGEDVDVGFLRAVAAETRAAGAILIFDEIITGFRYPGGSVQKSTGVIPDLACFGKALGNGFPVSALVGRRQIMSQMSRTFYGPTFKGEVYSLAAALKALSIYRAEPVAGHVWSFGRRLQEEVARACADIGIGARMIGPPFRTALAFDEPDQGRLTLMRTLYIQELLREGVITYSGVMLPSYAHDESTLATTIAAMSRALRRVHRASEEGEMALHRAIEIPLIAARL
jgi:glutamate-1-semialdehyde aminotransferase/predicted aldo/keto reductase-like oxidoreductase